MLALSRVDVPEGTEGRQPKGHSAVHLSRRAGNGATQLHQKEQTHATTLRQSTGTSSRFHPDSAPAKTSSRVPSTTPTPGLRAGPAWAAQPQCGGRGPTRAVIEAPPLTRSGGSARASVTQARSRGVGGARGRLGGCKETALPPFCRVFVAAAGERRRRFGDVSRPEGLLLLRR